jgi:CRISPR/Cas system-associated endonuclease Cas1
MGRVIFLPLEVGISRKNGTIQLIEKQGGRKARVPVVQTSEIFALSGAEPDGALLSLLSQYTVPLHIFKDGNYRSTYIPFAPVLSGKSVLAQVQTLEDAKQRWILVRELIRGAARLRCMASRILRPEEKEEWESRYMDRLASAYAGGLHEAAEHVRKFEEIDREFLKRENWSEEELPYAQGISKGVVLGALPRLSLDPWIGILHCEGSDIPPLAEDLLFLFSPLLTWLWPRNERPSPAGKNLPEVFRRHMGRRAAKNGARTWSLKFLPVREGYALIARFSMCKPYRCVSNVEVERLAE